MFTLVIKELKLKDLSFQWTNQQSESLIGIETVTYLAQVGCFDSHCQLEGDR